MKNLKFVLVFALVAALAALQVGTVFAAPLSATVPDGTIVSVTPTYDSNNVLTGYEVVVTDSNNTQQTVDLTVQEATAAGLVAGDGTIIAQPGDTIVNGVLVALNQPSDACSSSDSTNPVAGALSDFFCQSGLLGSTDTIDALHMDGFGYGEIAQACFMAESLGDGTTCGDILQAKKNHTLDQYGAPNWGLLMKDLLVGTDKSKTNLGAIMSGRGTAPTMSSSQTTTTTTTTNTHGHGNQGKGKGGGHGHRP